MLFLNRSGFTVTTVPTLRDQIRTTPRWTLSKTYNSPLPFVSWSPGFTSCTWSALFVWTRTSLIGVFQGLGIFDSPNFPSSSVVMFLTFSGFPPSSRLQLGVLGSVKGVIPLVTRPTFVPSPSQVIFGSRKGPSRPWSQRQWTESHYSQSDFTIDTIPKV